MNFSKFYIVASICMYRRYKFLFIIFQMLNEVIVGACNFWVIFCDAVEQVIVAEKLLELTFS